MLGDASQALKIPDLRKRILFTLAMIAAFRFGSHVPVPGVDVGQLQELFKSGFLGFLDIFSGGALSNFAIFALGIMPYITASIIMSLLVYVVPKLEEWQKEGETGQKKINQYTRYGTLGLSFFQSIALVVFLDRTLTGVNLSLSQTALMVITITTGTMVVMWIGELITQFGIGNGMSLLMFVSIVSRFPIVIAQSLEISTSLMLILSVAVLLITAIAIVIVDSAQRRIPVQYAKRMVGRKMYGGASTYIPLKINQAGVIPIIFASSLLLFPGTFLQFFPGGFAQSLSGWVSPGSAIYLSLYGGLTIFFTYFYTAVTVNPIKYSDQMRKYGGFIPGVRPGRPTAEFLDRVLTRITLPGAVFLAIIAITPSIMLSWTRVPFFAEFGGTSILIMVGVALETMRQIEAQLLMRHYEGFLK